MSDSSDDMEAYSGFCEDQDDIPKVRYFLEKIANAELKDFNNQQHMINYMKKMARLAYTQLKNEGYYE